MTSLRCFGTPRPGDLGLRRIANRAGMSVELLPNGSLFAIGHDHDRGRTLISQIEGAALEGGIGRLVLRRRDGDPATAGALAGRVAGPTPVGASRETASRRRSWWKVRRMGGGRAGRFT